VKLQLVLVSRAIEAARPTSEFSPPIKGERRYGTPPSPARPTRRTDGRWGTKMSIA